MTALSVSYLDGAVAAARRHGRDFDAVPLTALEGRELEILQITGYTAAQAGQVLAGQLINLLGPEPDESHELERLRAEAECGAWLQALAEELLDSGWLLQPHRSPARAALLLHELWRGNATPQAAARRLLQRDVDLGELLVAPPEPAPAPQPFEGLAPEAEPAPAAGGGA